jgi:hypothetical protein
MVRNHGQCCSFHVSHRFYLRHDFSRSDPTIFRPNWIHSSTKHWAYTTPNPSDFGAIWDGPPFNATPPGTYFVGHLTVSLGGLAPGVYVLRTDATNMQISGHASSVGSYSPPNTFADEFIPNSEYTITVVPEPGSLALLSLGAIGLIAASRMRKVTSR